MHARSAHIQLHEQRIATGLGNAGCKIHRNQTFAVSRVGARQHDHLMFVTLTAEEHRRSQSADRFGLAGFRAKIRDHRRIDAIFLDNLRFRIQASQLGNIGENRDVQNLSDFLGRTESLI